MKFTIPHDKVWFRPDKAYFESQSQSQGIDSSEIEWNGKYKSIRELRDLAIFGEFLPAAAGGGGLKIGVGIFLVESSNFF